MPSPAISVENLSKSYRLGHAGSARGTLARMLGGMLGRGGEDDSDTLWALRDVSFEVQPGEVVGIIGRNGAGKSTLLKILSRITAPTTGRAVIRGRVSSLLEVGTGFHPELTGRENVYMNGSILGMTRAEVDRKFDEIVDFSGVERFLDTPLKRYSSGMRVRLAFAVAAHLDPEIMIVDEVLAVGDAEFQHRCLRRMERAAELGQTVLLVSHNLGSIARLCPRVMLLEKGELNADAAAEEVLERYVACQDAPSEWRRPEPGPRHQGVCLDAVCIEGGAGNKASRLAFRLPIKIAIDWSLETPANDAAIVARVVDARGATVLTSWDVDGQFDALHPREPGRHRSTCEIPGSLLAPGRYFVGVGVRLPRREVREFFDAAVAFEVTREGFPLNHNRSGIIAPSLRWTTDSFPADAGRRPDA